MIHDQKSIYIQIAETIENEILQGTLKENDQVPSTNQLARVYSINPATAGKGINILVDEEILYKKRGLGMFVAKDAYQKVVKKRQEHFYRTVLPSVWAEAKQLQISVEDLQKSLQKLSKEER